MTTAISHLKLWLCCLSIVAEAAAQSDDQWAAVLARLDSPTTRDEAVHTIDLWGSRGARLLIEEVKPEKPEKARRLLCVVRELAHHAASHYAKIETLRRQCPNHLVPDVLEVQLEVLPFLDSRTAEERARQLSVLVDRKLRTAEDKGRFTRISYCIAEICRQGKRPPLTMDLQVSGLIAEIERPWSPYRAAVAARLLGRFGTQARHAAPKLLRLMRRPIRRPGGRWNQTRRSLPAPQTHRWVAVALTKIAPGTEEAAEAHGYLLLYGDSVEMRQAIHAIRKKPDCAEPAVPYLLECLRYCNKAGRDFTSTEKVEVITTLGILAQRSSRAIPILADYYADHEDRRLASAAQAALRSIRRATAGKR